MLFFSVGNGAMNTGGSSKRMGTLSSAFAKAGVMNFIPSLEIRFRLANSCTRRRGSFKGLSQDGGWRIFLKTSAPLSLIKAFRVNLISAGSMSLDSTQNCYLVLPLFTVFHFSLSHLFSYLILNFLAYSTYLYTS